MPKLKEPCSLLDLALSNIHHLVREEALRVAHLQDTVFHYSEIKGTPEYDEDLAEEIAFKGDVYTDGQVEAFKQYIFSHVPYNLIDQVLDPILFGISEAIKAKKKQWRPTTLMTKFCRSMFAITEFSDLMVLRSRRFLDLQKVPKILRNRMFRQLTQFVNATTLILGSGSGGWVVEAYAEQFILGLPYMKHLIHFSLNYDCNGSILQVLSETCNKSLKVLDIERSQQVKDDSIPYINACKQLIKINIFGIAIDFNGMVRYFLVNISITILWLELLFVKSKFKSCRQKEEKVHVIQVHVQKRKVKVLACIMFEIDKQHFFTKVCQKQQPPLA